MWTDLEHTRSRINNNLIAGPFSLIGLCQLCTKLFCIPLALILLHMYLLKISSSYYRTHLTLPLHPPTSLSHFTLPLYPPTLPSHFTLPLHPPTSPSHLTLPLHSPTLPSHFTLPLYPPTSPSHFTIPPHCPTVGGPHGPLSRVETCGVTRVQHTGG